MPCVLILPPFLSIGVDLETECRSEDSLGSAAVRPFSYPTSLVGLHFEQATKQRSRKDTQLGGESERHDLLFVRIASAMSIIARHEKTPGDFSFTTSDFSIPVTCNKLL